MSFILNAIKNILHRMLQLVWFGKKTISNSLNIYIKTNTGSTLSVDLDPAWDIKDVKEFVAPQLGLKPTEVKIIFAGKELGDSITISECDLGQQSTLHAIKIRNGKDIGNISTISEESDEKGSKPLCETLKDSDFSNEDNAEEENARVHFYVFCSTCKAMKSGKIRVRCHFCKSGALTVHSDPQSWRDVLEPKRITGLCENNPELCADILNNAEPTFAEFYFKCSEHTSLGESDEAVPLYLIRPNLRNVPCLACADISELVFVFPCEEAHVTCLDCFRQYCTTRLRERQFWQHPDYGYTLACPAGCPDSFIKEIHHFRLLSDAQYSQYHRFATEEFVLRSGGVLCPQPGCGMGILADPECTKITCISGCGYVFCRLCLQGYHIGECQAPEEGPSAENGECNYNVDPARAASARWDEASKVTIKVLTKPCPKCRTPTERDGGCMHMVCTRSGCDYHWCWVCQTAWTRNCMGSHWQQMNCCIKREFYEELKEKPRIPRPPNAFMLYANENRKRMSQMFPTESNKDISKRLGNGWKNLDEDERKNFFDKAKAIGLQHKKEYPDYVYNPKEARIRKAMRDATRERSIGASPMLPRPSARRAPHSWSHEDLMMSPLGGMRSPMDCGFPFPSGVGGGGGGGGNGGAGYGGKLEAPPPPPPTSSSVVHTNYIQSNPLAQLQQHTEMWPDYQNLRPRSSGNPFMMPEVSPYHQQQQQQQQHQQSSESPMAGMMQMERNSLHHHQMGGVGNSLGSPGNSSRDQQRHHHHHHQHHDSPTLNEHTPPPEASCSPGEPSGVMMGVVDPEKMQQQQQQSDICGEYENKLVIENQSQQTIDSSQQHQQEHFMPVFEQNEANDAATARHAGVFEKLEDVKMKKNPDNNRNPGNVLYLPLSSQSFKTTASLTNNVKYQHDYILEYFEGMPSMTLMNITTQNGISFPYATYCPSTLVDSAKNEVQVFENMSEPNFFHTDVGYIPLSFMES